LKIKLRFDASNPEHTLTTVFIGGKNVGKLCLGTEDIPELKAVLKQGVIPEFEGEVYKKGE